MIEEGNNKHFEMSLSNQAEAKRKTHPQGQLVLLAFLFFSEHCEIIPITYIYGSIR